MLGKSNLCACRGSRSNKLFSGALLSEFKILRERYQGDRVDSEFLLERMKDLQKVDKAT